MGVIVFNITLTCTITIACHLLLFELNESVGLDVIVASGNFCSIVGLTFAYHALSEWITSDLFEIGDIFFNSPWQQLPPKHQKLLVLSIQRAQRELRLSGLGLFNCSLAVFGTVNVLICDDFCVNLSQFLDQMNKICQFSTCTDHSNGCLIFFDDAEFQVNQSGSFGS